MKIALPSQAVSDLFDLDKVAKLLSDSLKSVVKPTALPISKIEYQSQYELLVTAKTETYLLNTTTYTLFTPPSKKPSDPKNISPPNNKWEAYTKNHTL